jgi:hypothetical protein
MDMQQRIDALIQMRREKPEHKREWHRLEQALLQEPKLLTSEQSEALRTAFDGIMREELLEQWDSQFHEVIITGKITDIYESKFTSSITGSGQYASSAASLTLGKSTMTETELAQVKQMLAQRLDQHK